MILGSGDHKYELVEGWGMLPEGVQFGYTHGVVTDKNDNVYVHNQSEDAVCIFDKDGNFLDSWGKEFASGAHGMYLSRENGSENLYLADYVRHTVVKTTLDGDVIYRLGVPPRPDIYESEDKYMPTGSAVAPNGDLYICDGYGESWVHRYSPEGDYIQSWGGDGDEPGKMKCPHGIWIDTRIGEPRVLVADRANVRLQYFTLDGELIEIVTGGLRYPCGFFQDDDNMIIPDLYGRVTIFDKSNTAVAHLGDNPGVWEKEGWPNLGHEHRTPGVFNSPHAACVDSSGDMYVVEWVSDGCLTKLKKHESQNCFSKYRLPERLFPVQRLTY